MQIVWEDLGLSINDPEQKQQRIGPQYVKNYQEALKLLSKHDFSGDWDERDLSFLDKSAENLSEDELWDWGVYIMSVRAGLKKVIEGSE